MDPAVKNLLMAISGQSAPDDEDYYFSAAFHKLEDMSFGGFMHCIRTIVAPMGSEKTLKVLSILLDEHFIGLFAGMNFGEFSKLFPSEKDFLLKVLRIYTSPKHANKILYLNLFVTEKYGSYSPPKMDQELCTEFIKMKNLNSIYIDQYFFTLQDLIAMSTYLPALIKIKVLIDSESWLPLEVPDFAQIFEGRFSNLEEFIYLIRDLDSVIIQSKLEFFGKFTNFCIKHLPKARVVSCEDNFFDMTEACEEIEHTSLMEHLQLDPNNLDRVASNAEKFPHVSALTLNWNEFKFAEVRNKKKWHSLKKLTKMTHLNNFKLNSLGCLEHVLSIFGANLRILSFCFTSDENAPEIDLKMIQENCPKLENLDTIEAFVDDSFYLGSFQSLLDLQITFKYNYTEEVNISNLLAAPNLKVAKLRNFRVNRDKLRMTILLIKTKAILTKVETLSLTLDGSMNADLKECMKKEFGYLINAVQDVRQGVAVVHFGFDR